MPRHIEKCYYCDAEYEIIYSSIDHNMLDDEDNEEGESEDYPDNEPCYCPFCGAEL